MSVLAEWHAARNSLVADEHAERARRFGLQLLAPNSEGLPPVIDNLAGRTIWAWQPASPALAATGDDRTDVRVGVAGSRLHLGHLSLARDVAWLQEKGHSVTFISRQTRTTASATVVELLTERVKQFDGRTPNALSTSTRPRSGPSRTMCCPGWCCAGCGRSMAGPMTPD